MIRLVLIAAMLLAGTGALAQQPALSPPFAPFQVDEKSYTDLLAYLRQQPYMFSAPVIQWLEQAAARAREEEKEKQKK
jgi:hypothetical protein